MSTAEREEIAPTVDEKQPENSPTEAPEPTFIQHRIFLNQVDSYHAKYIAAVSHPHKLFQFFKPLLF